MQPPPEKTVKRPENKADFYNPQGKPVHALLSRQEKIRGRFLPRLAQVSLFALSIAITGMTEGGNKAALSAAFFGGVSFYLRRSATKKFNDSVKDGEVYDFTKPRDVAAFQDKYPTQQNLPTQFKIFTTDAGFEKPVLFSVTAAESFAAIGKTTGMMARPEYAVRIGRSFLNDASPALVAHVCAHELGHASRGHIEDMEPIAILTAQGMHLKAGTAMALSGNLMGGLLYTTFNLVASLVAHSKQMQSYEYEADRYALVKSGVIDEAARTFEQDAPVRPAPSERMQRVTFEVGQALGSLLDVHPASEKRAAYMRQYDAINHEAARKTRISIGVRP